MREILRYVEKQAAIYRANFILKFCLEGLKWFRMVELEVMCVFIRGDVRF